MHDTISSRTHDHGHAHICHDPFTPHTVCHTPPVAIVNFLITLGVGSYNDDIHREQCGTRYCRPTKLNTTEGTTASSPQPQTTSPGHHTTWRANKAIHTETLSGWRSWRNQFRTNGEFRPLACKNHPWGFRGYEIDLVSELAKDRRLCWQICVELIGTVAETFLRARMRVVSWRAEHNGSRFLNPLPLFITSNYSLPHTRRE